MLHFPFIIYSLPTDLGHKNNFLFVIFHAKAKMLLKYQMKFSRFDESESFSALSSNKSFLSDC